MISLFNLAKADFVTNSNYQQMIVKFRKTIMKRIDRFINPARYVQFQSQYNPSLVSQDLFIDQRDFMEIDVNYNRIQFAMPIHFGYIRDFKVYSQLAAKQANLIQSSYTSCMIGVLDSSGLELRDIGIAASKNLLRFEKLFTNILAGTRYAGTLLFLFYDGGHANTKIINY